MMQGRTKDKMFIKQKVANKSIYGQVGTMDNQEFLAPKGAYEVQMLSLCLSVPIMLQSS